MRVLIVGFGSIGKRHFQNFQSLGCEVAVLSRRALIDFKCFTNLEKAMDEFKPSHIVVANETSEHGNTLEAVLNFDAVKKVLVEKPLYAQLPRTFPVRGNDIFVAYNLRFHPMIIELKKKINAKNMISWHSYVGQYLPSWRPDRDYREVYSSSAESGGGVLRDLSHEIDLFQYFSGSLDLKFAYGGHFSQLEINADDNYSLLLSGEKCAHANVHMNCVDRLTQRFLTVHTDDDTYFLDLIQGRWRDSDGERTVSFDKNQSYLDMAKAFLENDSHLCTFKEGCNINSIIEKAELLK